MPGRVGSSSNCQEQNPRSVYNDTHESQQLGLQQQYARCREEVIAQHLGVAGDLLISPAAESG
eukprot:1158630-Karenia_brevis.AAC.1